MRKMGKIKRSRKRGHIPKTWRPIALSVDASSYLKEKKQFKTNGPKTKT